MHEFVYFEANIILSSRLKDNKFYQMKSKNIKVVVIDNYDSFTFNLVHYLESLSADVKVIRKDQVEEKHFDNIKHILISPGPGHPNEYTYLDKIIYQYQNSHSILGICLGHQYLASYYGSTLYNLKKVRHGISSELRVVDHEGLFKNIPKKFKIGHYHSWNVKTLSNDLTETALNNNGLNMAFRHKRLNIFGIQFHPESILTEHGKEILKNWLLI